MFLSSDREPWISTLSQPLRKPHDPIYSPPLRHVHHSVCTHLVYKAFGFPSYGPTVHLICRLSGATVGPYDGDTGCFVLSTNHPVHRLVYKAFGFCSSSVFLLAFSSVVSLHVVPLSPDWTKKHKKVAEEHNHTNMESLFYVVSPSQLLPFHDASDLLVFLLLAFPSLCDSFS